MIRINAKNMRESGISSPPWGAPLGYVIVNKKETYVEKSRGKQLFLKVPSPVSDNVSFYKEIGLVFQGAMELRKQKV